MGQNNIEYHALQRTDKHFMDAFDAFAKAAALELTKVSYSCYVDHGAIEHTVEDFGQALGNDPLLRMLAEKDQHHLSRLCFSFSNGCMLTVSKPEKKPVGNVSLQFSPQMERPERWRLSSELQKIIPPFYNTEETEADGRATFADKQSYFEEYERILKQLLKSIRDERSEAQAASSAQLAELEKTFKFKDDELKERAAKFELYRATREAELLKEDARTARRNHQLRVQNELDERRKSFHLTEETSNLRRPIEIVFIGLALVSFGLLALFTLPMVMFEMAAADGAGHAFDSIDAYMILGRQVLSSIVFFAVVFFYIRWKNSWFERHAKSELDYMRMDLDFSRAFWVVESILESQDKNMALPQYLVERLTNDLFSEDDSPKLDDRSPFEKLAANLLKSTADAEINLPSGPIRFSAKGARLRKKK